MRKRMLSLFCVLALCLGLLPATALAAGSWTYYPKSDVEDRLYGYIKQGDLQVGVRSEAEEGTGEKSPYNLIIGSNGDKFGDATALDLTGTITDSSGTPCVIIEDSGTTGRYQITSVLLPDTVKRISANAYSNAALTSISFPASLESIEHSAFYGSALKEADLSKTRITTLESSTFSNCASLTSVQLPSTLTFIEGSAFYNCTSLTEITLNATTPPTFDSWSLSTCSSLKVIYVPTGSVQDYRTAEGWKDYAEKIWGIGEIPVTYGLSVSSPEVDFGSFVAGNVPEAKTVTITNTGTGEVTIQLPSNENFDITAGAGFTGDTATIAGNGTASFTIRPKDSTVDKTVSEKITIQGTPTDSDSPAQPSVSVTASYTVTAKLTYTISAAPEMLSFGSFTAGEALPAAQTVTVSNTGTGTVEVSLPTSGKFTITEGTGFSNGKVTLEPNEKTTFTVQPADISTDGTVSEQLTITGTSVGADPNETSTATVEASYTVAFPKVTVGGVELKAAPGGAAVYALTDDTGAVTTEGASASQYNIKWDGKTLTLKEAVIAVTGQHGIQSDADLILALESDNSIRIDKQEGSSTSYYGIYAGKDLTITGTGSLDITADSGAIRAAVLTVWDAVLSLVSQSSSGISANSMTVESGRVTVRGQDYGISVTGTLSVSSTAYLNARGDRAALEANSITIAGTPYTEQVDNIKIIIEDGTLTQTGVLYVDGVDILEDGAVLPQGVSYEQSTNTLTLTNAVIKEYYESDRSFCGIYTNGDLNLALEGSSSISSRAIVEREQFYGIAVQGALTISGTGNLEIAGAAGPEGTISYGIMPLDGFTLQSGSVTVTLGSCWQNMGLYGGTGVLVEGGALTIKPSAAPQTAGVSMGILSEAGSDDLNGKSAVHITGGTVSVEGNELLIPATAVNDSSSTGISGSSILVEGGTVTARGGDITVEGADAEATSTAAVLSFGIGAGQLVIQGGTVTAQCGQISCTDENIQTTRSAFFFEFEYDENDYEAEKMLTVSPKAPGAIAVRLGSAEADAAEISGSPFTGKHVIGYDALKQAAYFHSESAAPLTLTADPASLTGGGTVSLTVGGPLAAQPGSLSLTCSDSSITVTGGPDIWTAALPNADKDYTFTVTYTDETYPDGVTAACTVRTTHRSSGGGSSSGGSSSDPTYSVTLPGRVEGGTVKTNKRYAEAGETFRFTAIPDKGWELDTLTVTDSRGREIDLTDKGDGVYSFTMPARRVEIEVSFREIVVEPEHLPFTDVPEDAWYAEAVRYVYEHGLMAGTSGSAFSPEGATTRGQIVTILWRMAGSPVVNYAMDFEDVDPAAYYGEAVRWAVSEGVVGGYGNGLFGTNDPITREQFAAMLYRFAQEQGYDVSIGENTNILSYTDVADLSEYAISAMQWAVGAGIINGTGDGSTLSPHGQATRAQAAVMLMRFCEEYVVW